MQRFQSTVGSHIRAHSDRKSTRLNSSHTVISYAVFCLKKKKTTMPLFTRGSAYATPSVARDPARDPRDSAALLPGPGRIAWSGEAGPRAASLERSASLG